MSIIILLAAIYGICTGYPMNWLLVLGVIAYWAIISKYFAHNIPANTTRSTSKKSDSGLDDYSKGYLEGEMFREMNMGDYPDGSKSDDYFWGFEDGYHKK